MIFCFIVMDDCVLNFEILCFQLIENYRFHTDRINIDWITIESTSHPQYFS